MDFIEVFNKLFCSIVFVLILFHFKNAEIIKCKFELNLVIFLKVWFISPTSHETFFISLIDVVILCYFLNQKCNRYCRLSRPTATWRATEIW